LIIPTFPNPIYTIETILTYTPADGGVGYLVRIVPKKKK